ncbi:integral peroxisomal membrane peroxin-domain-containing protein [Fimicolochytrium jonesii]|uniref:integral peroxisomal membrane peroxin-domain-containing protein n=1 Tax=Fimicolochytrium jonesii TaxID=1396493 RepID=UPI0022FF21CF|nr:integral peroxisomal membrane peroxin-domain-containing protein [Fimicolochytrium jonesii]KAI8816315.1 integral peroxisomal membrane peroxin-domain-containing protein [Fimicolochytrium jonesii]
MAEEQQQTSQLTGGAHHHFAVTTFTKPTYCACCRKFLWGIIRQGLQCEKCGAAVHAKCQYIIESPCSAAFIDSLVAVYSENADSEPQLSEKSTGSDEDGTVVLSRRVRSNSSSAKSVASSTTVIPSSPSATTLASTSDTESPGIVADLIASTAINSAAMRRASSDQPALNLLTTTPKNLTRFVLRLDAVVQFQEELTEVLTWQNPSKTLVVMSIYVFLCLYPILFLVSPQLLIIYLIMRNYYEKAKTRATGQTTTPKVQYLKNLQFIQNSMGIYCDAYDDIKKNGALLDWSDADLTAHLLKMVLVSMFGVTIFVRFVPFNYVLLVAGVGVFLYNTAVFRAAAMTLPPVILKKLKFQVDTFKEAVKEARKTGDGSIVVVSLFENQRWWAGLGWIPHLLRSERGAWSDSTGTLSRPTKDLFTPPPDPLGDWEWADDDWLLDVGWADVDPNTGGWQYSDHAWANPRRAPYMSSLTRRRMWVRKMRLVTVPGTGVAGAYPVQAVAPAAEEGVKEAKIE